MQFFGTDGIRDLAGEGRLAPDAVWRIGRALGRFAAQDASGAPRVTIGRDPRPSGPALVERLAAALADVGAEVEDLGVVPTPVVAWAVANGRLDLGIAVSASHNAAPYNGVKPLARGGRKLTVEEERRIEAAMEAASGAASGLGTESGPDTPSEGARPRPVDGARAYVDATASWLHPEGDLDGLVLVVDLAAGAASATAPAVLEALGARTIVLHEAGSRAINDGCGTESPDAWLAAVRDRGADAGIAFDGDADRVLIADATGTILDGDDALAILARDWKARGRLPGDRVVGTVMANLGVEERLASFGVALDRVPVGDRNVAARMREEGLAIGAEPSGHVVLERDGALIGDGLVAGVRLLQAARRSRRTLEALRAQTPRYPQILRNVRMHERRPLDAWPELTQGIADLERAFADRGRIVVRYSGTEPLLRIMVEGKDAQEVDAAVARLEAVATATSA